uniref:SET domain-containing protein n=1 Tax=Ditylenchus dipsaci TaxID=166011 RepID=A0A915EAE6_9BILA
MAKSQPLIDKDLSKGKALYPIPVINTVDDSKVETRFHYIQFNVDDKELTDRALRGCDCVGKCVRGSCKCIDNSSIYLYPDGRVKHAAQLYERFEKLFSTNVMKKLALARANTPKAGWAVRSRQFIECGTFIAEFVGEILSPKEAEIRRAPEDYSYQVANEISKRGHYVDPTRYGNISRFFNHSCLENLLPMRFFSSHRDETRPSIGFVALKDILPGSELTIDYGMDWWRKKIETLDDFYCQCDWLFCSFPDPDKVQLSLNAAKKEAARREDIANRRRAYKEVSRESKMSDDLASCNIVKKPAMDK